MNSAEARQILIACRPGTDDLRTPEAVEALEVVRRDPELVRWWQAQRAWHGEVRAALVGIPVPAGLPERILSRARIIELPWWRRPVVWQVAAAVVLLAALALFFLRPAREDTFDIFRSRMVGNVLRQYAMDVTTNDLPAIRAHMAARQAPSDFVLPAGLEKLPALGGGVLGWRDRRAAMVCLDSQTQGTLFLFVVDSNSVQRPPGQRAFSNVKGLETASWSAGGRTYVLAGSGSREWLQAFF